jgi:hypothetical protein
MEVRPAEFARMAGVSSVAICKKSKNKTLIVNAAGFLDTDNPVNAAYIARHKRDAAQPPPVAIQKVSPSKLNNQYLPDSPTLDDTEVARLSGLRIDLIHMTIRELILLHPGLDKIERYMKFYKEWTIATEKQQRIDERDLTLIPKDFVIARLFTLINTITKDLLDYPEREVEKIIAIVRASGEGARNEIIKTIKEGLGRIIAGAKEQIVSELSNLKSKYQNENTKLDRIEDIKEVLEEVQNG